MTAWQFRAVTRWDSTMLFGVSAPTEEEAVTLALKILRPLPVKSLEVMPLADPLLRDGWALRYEDKGDDDDGG